MVCFVHRPAYFNVEGGIPEIEYAELIFAKGRSTGMGMVEVAFIAEMLSDHLLFEIGTVSSGEMKSMEFQ